MVLIECCAPFGQDITVATEVLTATVPSAHGHPDDGVGGGSHGRFSGVTSAQFYFLDF